MRKKQVLITGLVLLAVSFMVTACDGGVRVGDLQTESQTVALDDADSVYVELQTGASDLSVSGGAGELLEATFIYNVEELEPRATYADGRLEVKQNDVDEGILSFLDLDEYRNDWDLRLNGDVPMEMEISLGAGPSNLTLGSLTLTALDINGGAGNVHVDLNGSRSLNQFDFDMGAGNVTIDLSGDWQSDLNARFSGGLGDVSLTLPSGVGVIVYVETGVGTIDANGLTRDGDAYTNDAYGVSDVTLRIDIEAGVGQIHLDVE